VPEWAIEMARDVGVAGHLPTVHLRIARALLSAYRSGLNDAAGIHDDEAERFDKAAIEEMSVAGKLRFDGNAVFHRHCAAAIRRLGEAE